jgi:hypothetical protein
MASQMAKHLFGVRKVVCRIFDPIREEMYRSLGMETIGPTRVVAGLLKEALESRRRGRELHYHRRGAGWLHLAKQLVETATRC